MSSYAQGYKPEPVLVWVDLETTGLDPAKDLILECAIVVTTTYALEELGRHLCGRRYRSVDGRRRCRASHRRRKMIILLDVDGVLADFVGASLSRLAGRFGRFHTREQITEWDFSSLPGFAEVASDFWESTKEPGFCASIEPYPEARAGVDLLRAIPGVSVEFLTSPMHGCPTWTHERDLWLEKHFGAHHHEVMHVRKKERVRGDILVDDKTDHIDAWSLANPKGIPILWAQPYNAGHVKTWTEVESIARALQRSRERSDYDICGVNR